MKNYSNKKIEFEILNSKLFNTRTNVLLTLIKIII